jgi:hypothetical protein
MVQGESNRVKAGIMGMMNLAVLFMVARLAHGAAGEAGRTPALLAMAASVPSLPGTLPDPYAQKAVPNPVSTTTYAESFRITLSGDPFTASPFITENIGMIPVGRWLNALLPKKVQHGSELVAQIENCSGYGCVVETADSGRIIIAKRGVADAIRLGIYDAGWAKIGASAVSDDGQVAIPVASPRGETEIWVVRQNGRLRKRIPHQVSGPALMRWHGSGLYMIHAIGGGIAAKKVSITTGAVETVDPLEAFWPDCGEGGGPPLTAGLPGEQADQLQGLTAVPVYRRGEPVPGTLELTRAARPMTQSGFAPPARVEFDCSGRINIVSATTDDIWCLRFGSDGKILNASKLSANMAGDFRSIRIDSRGRFYYLETELTGNDPPEPTQINLIRLR